MIYHTLEEAAKAIAKINEEEKPQKSKAEAEREEKVKRLIDKINKIRSKR